MTGDVVLLAAATAVNVGGLDLTQIFTFAQFGLLGVFFVMLVSKKFVVPKWTLDDLKEAHERELLVKDDIVTGQKEDLIELRKNVRDLQALTSEKMIPALVQEFANARIGIYRVLIPAPNVLIRATLGR